MMKPTMMYTANKKRIFKNANGRMVTMNSQNTAVPAFLAKGSKMVPLPPRKNTQPMKCNPCMMKAKMVPVVSNTKFNTAVKKMMATHNKIMKNKNMKAVKKVNIAPNVVGQTKVMNFLNYKKRVITIKNGKRGLIARYIRLPGGVIRKLGEADRNMIPKEIRPKK